MKKSIKNLFTSNGVMMTLVCLNVIAIFVGGFFPDSYAFICIDSAFTLLFLTEALVKISSASFAEYWKDGWNRFDFIITLVALPSLANLFIDGTIGTNVLLSLRVLRVFKSFRLIQFIPNINALLQGIRLACKASFVVALGFIVLLLVVSILTSALFGNAAPDYFDNPANSLYSIFKLFTIEGWYEIPETIASGSSPAMAAMAKVYFSIMLFIGGIIGVGLINAIFVDAMVSDNNDEVLEKLNALDQKIDKLSSKD